jgi:hypothetical protein
VSGSEVRVNSECEGALATLGCAPSLLSAPHKQVGSSPFIGISSTPCHSSEVAYLSRNSPKLPVDWGQGKNMFPTCSPVSLKNRELIK